MSSSTSSTAASSSSCARAGRYKVKSFERVERISDCTDELASDDAKVAELEVQIASLTAELEATRGDGASVARARAAALHSLIDDLTRFDQRIDCRDCEDGIKINGFMRRREGSSRAILEFHRELSARLAKLSESAEAP